MDVLKGMNLAIRFLLEICVLISVGYWGFKTGSGLFLRLVLGIGMPLLIAVIWAMFGAPRSAFRLQGPLMLMLEIIVFGSGVAALFLTKNTILAWVFAAIIVVNRVLIFFWGQ